MVETGRKAGPGRVFYLMALVPLLIGAAAMVGLILSGVGRLDERLEQIVVPGERTLRLEPGDHTVFLETRSVVDGRVYTVNYVPGVSVTVVGAGGTPVAVVPPNGSSTYTMGGREGHSIGRFQIETAGSYVVSGHYSEGDGPATVIAVAQRFMGGFLVTILTALGSLFGGSLLSALAVGLILVLRKRAGQPIP